MPATWAAVGGKAASRGQRLRVRARGGSQLPAGTSGTQGGDGPGAELTRRSPELTGGGRQVRGDGGPQSSGGWAPEQSRPGPPARRAHIRSVSSRSKPHVHTDLPESLQLLALCLVAGTRGSRAAFSLGPRARGAHSARRRKSEQGTGLGQQGRLVISLARLRGWEAEVPGSRADGRVFCLWRRQSCVEAAAPPIESDPWAASCESYAVSH